MSQTTVDVIRFNQSDFMTVQSETSMQPDSTAASDTGCMWIQISVTSQREANKVKLFSLVLF